MSIVVEHEKRRSKILERALDVFIDEGYENTTYQKIADRCKITRTTLYLYFKNKREIFNFSIKQFLQALEDDINEKRKKTGISCTEKLIQVMILIIERFEENRPLLSVVLDYLVHSSKGGQDPFNRVRRRTMRLRHIYTALILEGIKAREFSKSINVKNANELLYGILEAVIFRLTVLRRESADDLKEAMKLAVNRLVKNP